MRRRGRNIRGRPEGFQGEGTGCYADMKEGQLHIIDYKNRRRQEGKATAGNYMEVQFGACCSRKAHIEQAYGRRDETVQRNQIETAFQHAETILWASRRSGVGKYCVTKHEYINNLNFVVYCSSSTSRTTLSVAVPSIYELYSYTSLLLHLQPCPSTIISIAPQAHPHSSFSELSP